MEQLQFLGAGSRRSDLLAGLDQNVNYSDASARWGYGERARLLEATDRLNNRTASENLTFDLL